MKYIYLHGFASSPQSKKAQFFKKQFKKLNISIEIPDLNCGNFTELTLSCQIESIANILKKDPEKKFVLIGSSLGGYVSSLCVNLVNEYPVFKKIQKIVLMAPALNFYTEILSKDKKKLKEWKRQGFLKIEHYQWGKSVPLNYEFVEDAKKYEAIPLNRNIPTLIFHGIKDETVPYNLSVHYLEYNPMAKLILINSDHSLLNALNLIWNDTKNFLEL